MKAYIAYIKQNLLLTFRDRQVLFFNYLFPLIFFFLFGQLTHAERGGTAPEVVTMVLTIGVLGGGFFGAGIRAVQDREQNILRRFKVAPITPGPILAAGLISGLAHFIPVTFLVLLLAKVLYGMPFPERWMSLLVFISVAVLAFRAMGGIIAAVSNSMAESQIIIQILYFPMLFLSGATIPLQIMPEWVQTVAQFVPSTHLFSGVQMILVRKQGLMEVLAPLGSLLLTTLVGTVLAMKLFRWEKEETLPASSKAWVVAILLPFLGIGIWQTYSKEHLAQAKVMERQSRRERSRIFRDVRIVKGDGTVIERGGLLVRSGKIAEIYTGDSPDADAVKADAVEAAGKTLLPGLIDTHIHLGAPGGFMDYSKVDMAAQMEPSKTIHRELAAYLYSGVTAVRSVGDLLDAMEGARKKLDSGERAGAELFYTGPMFTTEGGHGTEYFRGMPENIRKQAEAQFVRLPKSPAEVAAQVAELKKQGVHAVKAILESGFPGRPFNRMDTAIYKAVAAAAKEHGLALATHTGNLRDIQDAVDAGTTSIEHGAMMEEIPVALFEQMKAKGVVYTPTLSVYESLMLASTGNSSMFDRSLVQQVGPAALLQSSKQFLQSGKMGDMTSAAPYLKIGFENARKNVLRAFQVGVTMTTGSDAGNPGVIHGPTVQRELQLMVEAGIPPAQAIAAATVNAAKLLGVANRTGRLEKGYEATMVLVDGNPLKDIAATEQVSSVLLKGERIDRAGLFEEDRKKK
ncbi:hypothetical protein F183_A23610 [Bryobacterales bacterium F-183]|nr:hypothetical protein F183_A23610 [Bryobacterales bacterium F-183]